LTIAKTRYQPFAVPQLINLKGISESTWERKRPVWEGDCDRDHHPRKRAKTKHDVNNLVVGDNDADSVDGTENGNKNGEEEGRPVGADGASEETAD
jgi:hypothetical protein